MYRRRKLKGNAGPLRSNERIHATLLDEVDEAEGAPPIGSLPSVPLPPCFGVDDVDVSDLGQAIDGEDDWYDCLECSDSEMDQSTPEPPVKKTRSATGPAFYSHPSRRAYLLPSVRAGCPKAPL